MASALKAVLLDLDGTLVDSIPGIHQALTHALAPYPDADCQLADVRRWVGNGPARLVERALAHNDLTADQASVLSDFSSAYAETLYNGTLYPGVTAGLDTLAKAGLLLACITNKPSPFTRPYLAHLGIDQVMKTVICADEVAQPKPHPESLILACERLGVDTAEAVMVGDSVNDLKPAQTLGMQRLAVTYGYHQDAEMAVHEPTALMDDFPAVVNWCLRQTGTD